MKKLLLLLALLLVALPASAQQTTQPVVTAPRPTAAWQLLQWNGSSWVPATAGGDTTAGTSAGLVYVTGLTGSGGIIAAKSSTLQWSSALTPTISQASTTGTTGANFTIAPQAATGAAAQQANFIVNLGAPPSPTTATHGELQLSEAGSLRVQVGSFPGSPNLYDALYLGMSGASPGGGNFAVSGNRANTALNATSLVGITINNGYYLESWNGTNALNSTPIIGDSSYQGVGSAYGSHGDVTTAFTATTTLSAAQFAMDFFVVSPAAATTLSGFPRAAAGAGYSKKFQVTSASSAVMISDGTHTVNLPSAVGMYIVEFTNAALYAK